METGIVAVGSIAGSRLTTAGQEQRSVGQLEPGYEVKVVNLRDGNELGPEERGELCIRSLFLMNDYYPDDVISEQGYDENGWYHTGDYGFYTAEGKLFRLARLTELIRAKEGFIVPSELEQIILEHPQVRDVTVVAVSDKITGLEVPRAYVTPHQGVNLAAEDMFKCERDIVSYVEGKGVASVCIRSISVCKCLSHRSCTYSRYATKRRRTNFNASTAIVARFQQLAWKTNHNACKVVNERGT